jgi:PTH2 family peptidyl-tRNA hydrolase
VSECVLKASKNESKTLQRYLREGARKIVVAAPHLEGLRRIYGEASESGLITHMVKDAGHTEIPAGTVTVVGIGPGPRSTIDSITSSLPLVK